MPLSISTWVDQTCLRPTAKGIGTKITVAIEVEATAPLTPNMDGRARQPSRTVLALDVSGSMQGEPLDHVIRSVDRLLDALSPDDEIGIVAFSDNATKVVEPVRVDANGKRLVRSRVGRLHADASTNIEAGLDAAAAMMTSPSPSPSSGMRKGVVLLSDGSPNVGAHTADLLRAVVRRHRPTVSFFALGYGVHHCEDVLSAIGEAGGGGYEFVQDPAACMRSFARALGAQGDVIASGVELVLELADGIELVGFIGNEQTRFSREGVVVALADMVAGAKRVVVAELRVTRAPSMDRFLAKLLETTVRWRDPSSPTPSLVASMKSDAAIEIADREPALVSEAARRIFLVRADQAREVARGHADRGQFGAAAAGLRALMTEIAALSDWVPNDGSPLAEAYELLVDEVMAFERRPSAEQYAQFRKEAVQSKLAMQMPKSAKSRGGASQKWIEYAAGDCPIAFLSFQGQRHRLEEEALIGRTSDADIQVHSDSVSRRHARVYANEGKYWVSDLGSTNTTCVNQTPIRSAPHELRAGDVIMIGAMELRYEEEEKKP